MPYLAAALVTALCGVAHGLKTERWAVSDELRTATARVKNVPLKFGDWVGREGELDGRTLEAGAITGYVSRRYENTRTGSAFGVLVVCGRPGPISVHTPDICYAAAGYAIAGSQARLPLTYGEPPRGAELFWADFAKPESLAPSKLRIFWTWSAGGPWHASDNPRLSHAAHRALYKLYVTRDSPGPAAPTGQDDEAAFLKELLPVLDRALIQPPAPPSSAPAAPAGEAP